MKTELLRPPQPPSAVQIQPPPAFVPLNFRPDARGPRPRSASPTLLTELPPPWPITVPIPEPLAVHDMGHRPPGRPVRVPRLPPSPFLPLPPARLPSAIPGADIRRRPPSDGLRFDDAVHDRRRRTHGGDGRIGSRPPQAEVVRLILVSSLPDTDIL